MRRAAAAGALLCTLVIGGCWYGWPDRISHVEDARVSPRNDIVVAIVSFERISPPHGLAKFPDGGIPYTLDQGDELWVCTPATRRFRHTITVHEAKEARGESMMREYMIGWGDTTVTFRLPSGRHATMKLPPGLHAGVDSTPGAPALQEAGPCAAPLHALKDSLFFRSDSIYARW